MASSPLSTFEFAQVAEVFALPRPELDPWYEFSTCAVTPGLVPATGGVHLRVEKGLGALDRAGTILIPGWPVSGPPASGRLIRKLVRAHRAGARLVSICSGAFLLAEAGLLDGRRATTHWRYAEAFREAYPEVELDEDVLFLEQERIYTSAGSAAGLDLCLHIVRTDHGSAVANEVARRLVLPPHREGGQRQFVRSPVPRPEDGHVLARTLDRIRRHLEQPYDVDSMARLASMSPRTFRRRFREVTGSTPLRWLTEERVRLAQELLETTDEPMASVAEKSGFGEPQLLRLHFRRRVGTAPSVYRKRFRGT